MTPDAAVAPDNRALSVLDGLTSLVDKSLLQRVGGSAHREPRFSMLETVREFGLEQLGESGELDEVSRLHAAYFLALAEQREPAASLHHPTRCARSLCRRPRQSRRRLRSAL